MFICLCLSGDCRRRACKVEVEHAALAHLNAEQAAFQTSMTEVQVTKQKKTHVHQKAHSTTQI